MATDRNGYQDLLHDAIRAHRSIEVVDAHMKPSWVGHARRNIDVVHLHWLEYLLMSSLHGPWRRRVRAHTAAASVVFTAVALRAVGVRLVWTAHNPRPHDPKSPRVQRVLYLLLARVADAVIVHNEYSARVVRERLRRRGKIWVAPHGNYLEAYPPSSEDRAVVRNRYRIDDDAFLVLAFGQVRSYKRIPELVREFGAMTDERFSLLVAGPPVEAEVERDLRRVADGLPRVVLDLRFIPDAEVTAMHEAADVTVINYGELYSSGVLLLSLSMGRPVLVRNAGAAEELAEPPAIVPFQPGALSLSLEALSLVDGNTARAAALAAARRASWDDSARRHLDAYGVEVPHT